MEDPLRDAQLLSSFAQGRAYLGARAAAEESGKHTLLYVAVCILSLGLLALVLTTALHKAPHAEVPLKPSGRRPEGVVLHSVSSAPQVTEEEPTGSTSTLTVNTSLTYTGTSPEDAAAKRPLLISLDTPLRDGHLPPPSAFLSNVKTNAVFEGVSAGAHTLYAALLRNGKVEASTGVVKHVEVYPFEGVWTDGAGARIYIGDDLSRVDCDEAGVTYRYAGWRPAASPSEVHWEDGGVAGLPSAGLPATMLYTPAGGEPTTYSKTQGSLCAL